MEDIINALLEVVRAQHTATEGTDETPFNMDDIVDMALNILGRPDESQEEAEMVNSIQSMVESLAPDIFPPKTFEQMDETEKAASASSMIENRFLRGNNGSDTQNSSVPETNSVSDPVSYQYEEEPEEETTDAGDLNDLIYKNFMEMMGLNAPQVEFPFDRSQIRYGKEKSVTEQLQEEEAEKEKEREEERQRKLSAWELAQNAVDTDEAAHAKEPYMPPVEEPVSTKSASQMAAEAIRQSEEENRMKLEIEKRAEALMAEAQKRGQDPMQFALHQQEILQYMEKNSDELVSFEDYEDLSPEEKLEIERQIHIEKQKENGVAAEDIDYEVPEEYIPKELKQEIVQPEASQQSVMPDLSTFDEDTLRALSQQVLQENSDMILAENEEEDMGSLNEQLFANLRNMLSGGGVPMEKEDVGDLLSQVARDHSEQPKQEEAVPQAPEVKEEVVQEETRGLSAVELAMAAQKAAKPEPQEEKKTVSAADLAKIAQQQELSKKQEETESEENEISLDDFDDIFESDLNGEEMQEISEETSEESVEEMQEISQESSEQSEASDEQPKTEEQPEKPEDDIEEDEDEYEYVDPDELVLGEHTQAEIDEAMANLESLGLEGDVYERAKRMLLLELAGSEAALDAWLLEQETGKKKKAPVSAIDRDSDDLSNLNQDHLEEELEELFDKDFEMDEEEDSEDSEEASETESEEVEETEESEEAVDTEEPEEEAVDTEESGEVEEISSEEVETEQLSEHELEVETSEVSPIRNNKSSKSGRGAKSKKSVVHKKEKLEHKKHSERKENTGKAEERGYEVSVAKPFVLKNSTAYIDKFEQFIVENQENRKLSTGFKKLDALLRYGLHKGSYFIDADPQYLKNSFMQQMADRAAESGVDVLYISTELSRYDLMVDTMSRLSYEMNQQDAEKAHSVMSIMTGEDGATLESLEDELNWYRGRISEHLFILDQEAVDEFIDNMEEEVSAGAILEKLIRSIVIDGAHKPVVFIDNIENILSVEDSEDMKPLMDGIKQLAKELSIPIIMSYGYAQAESEEEMSPAEKEFHESIGNMCDVYLEILYADMITEDMVELTEEDIREMVEDGDSLLIDILIKRNRRTMRASCQIETVPKYNFFME